MTLVDLLGGTFGFIFTILVFSYILGDNPLFRLTIHLFIGVAAGFAGAVALRNVILPQMIFPLLEILVDGPSTENLLVLVPLVLSVLLLTKISKRLSRLGNVSMAYLVGVGAATAIGGAVLGTLFPQIGASIALFDLTSIQVAGLAPEEQFLLFLEPPIILIGTLTTLIYFHFGTKGATEEVQRPRQWMETAGKLGQGFVAITFGALFAGVYVATLTALIERVHFLWQFVNLFL